MAAAPAAMDGSTVLDVVRLPGQGRRAAGRALSVGVAERRAIVLLGDLGALLASLLVTAAFVPKPSWLLALTTTDRMVTVQGALVLVALWVVASVVTDCYDLTLARSKYYSPLRAGGVAFLVHVAYPLVP